MITLVPPDRNPWDTCLKSRIMHDVQVHIGLVGRERDACERRS